MTVVLKLRSIRPPPAGGGDRGAHPERAGVHYVSRMVLLHVEPPRRRHQQQVDGLPRRQRRAHGREAELAPRGV
jgi:hypothetical protein